MSDADFWRLTLREFNGLCKRKRLDDRRQEYNAALICSVVANVNRRKNGRIWKASDFMAKEKPVIQDWREMKKMLKGLTKSFGAKKCRKK